MFHSGCDGPRCRTPGGAGSGPLPAIAMTAVVIVAFQSPRSLGGFMLEKAWEMQPGTGLMLPLIVFGAWSLVEQRVAGRTSGRPIRRARSVMVPGTRALTLRRPLVRLSDSVERVRAIGRRLAARARGRIGHHALVDSGERRLGARGDDGGVSGNGRYCDAAGHAGEGTDRCSAVDRHPDRDPNRPQRDRNPERLPVRDAHLDGAADDPAAGHSTRDAAADDAAARRRTDQRWRCGDDHLRRDRCSPMSRPDG